MFRTRVVVRGLLGMTFILFEVMKIKLGVFCKLPMLKLSLMLVFNIVAYVIYLSKVAVCRGVMRGLGGGRFGQG